MNAREEWLAARKSGIGGSDIAALIGMSPYKTQLQLWMDKTGRAEEQFDDDAVERMHWGTVLEDVVARHYAEQRGVKVQRINTMMRHPEANIALANVDRVIVEEGTRARWDEEARRVLGASKVLEVKTAHALARNSAEWGEPGTEDVPQSYWLQTQWYMGITGLPVADLAVLFGGQKFVTYVIPFDAGIFSDLLGEADAWWKRHVIADIPPEATTEDDARRLWKSHVAGKEKIVDANVAKAVQQLADTKARITTLEKSAQELRDIICTSIGDAEAISYMGQKLATWKQNKASSKTDWKAVATEAVVDSFLIQKHTTTAEGARVLRLSTTKE